MRLTEMEIPLIDKRTFNKFSKYLPAPSGNCKIPALVVISCVIWLIRHGRYLNDIPVTYGKADTIRKRFARWSKRGVFRAAFHALAAKLGKRNISMIDSTVVKAYRTACSMRCDNQPRQIGKSKGGFTTKIHLIANIERKPLDFHLTGGEVNDCKEAKNLIQSSLYRMKKLLGDKAYDSNEIRAKLASRHIEACIPAKSNRKYPSQHDKNLYK